MEMIHFLVLLILLYELDDMKRLILSLLLYVVFQMWLSNLNYFLHQTIHKNNKIYRDTLAVHLPATFEKAWFGEELSAHELADALHWSKLNSLEVTTYISIKIKWNTCWGAQSANNWQGSSFSKYELINSKGFLKYWESNEFRLLTTADNVFNPICFTFPISWLSTYLNE